MREREAPEPDLPPHAVAEAAWTNQAPARHVSPASDRFRLPRSSFQETARRKGLGPEGERKCVVDRAKPSARHCRLSVAPTANAETARRKSTERERVRRWYATDWRQQQTAQAGGAAARRSQKKERCAPRPTPAGDSRECDETSCPGIERRGGEMVRAWICLHAASRFARSVGRGAR